MASDAQIHRRVTRDERARLHQLHPAKLATDWGTAIVAGGRS